MENIFKTLSITGIFLLLISVSIIAQAKDAIPDNVEQTLANKYPNAENIAWQQYLKDEYLATFVLNEQEVNVFINYKGEFVESNIQLDEEHIPAKILDQLSKIPNGGDVHYILNTMNSSSLEFYRAKVKIDNNHYEFLFDQNQTLIEIKPIGNSEISSYLTIMKYFSK